MRFLRINWLPLIVVGMGFCASLALALAPLNFLLLNTIPDDSFYYFQIARNIVHGLGSTFDGINLTNGYHPLWMLLLLPIFAYFSSPVVMDVAPIHAALSLSAVFNAGIGLVLFVIISRYTSNAWIKALALGAWFFNPFNLYSMADGLETALSILLIASFFLTALRFQDRRTLRSLALVGVVAGFMMLARLDNVFYFLMFLSWLVYDGGIRASMRNVLFVGVIASIVVSPWLLWNFFTFGMFLTSASAAYTIVNHRIIYQDNGETLFQTLKAIVFMTDYSLRQFVIPRTGAPSVFFTLLGLTAIWFMLAEGRLRSFIRSIPLELFLVGGWALIFIANASIRWSPREWYFVALNFFIAIWIAWLLEKLRESGKLRMSLVALVACFVAALYFISWEKYLHNAYSNSPQVLEATLWMNDNLPKGSVIGAFNAGMEGYFSTNRLINLDGLVNNEAYEAIRDRRLWGYVKEERIEYLADQGKHVQYRMRSSLGIPNVLDELEILHETAGGPAVYRIK